MHYTSVNIQYRVSVAVKAVINFKQALQVLGYGCLTDVACHSWGCLQAPVHIWTDSAGPPMGCQLAIRVWASSCVELYHTYIQ